MAQFDTGNSEQVNLANMYRSTFFRDAQSKACLHDMALRCKHFETPETEDDVVLQNFFKTILFNLGVLHDGTTEEIIDAYAKVDYTRSVSSTKERP